MSAFHRPLQLLLTLVILVLAPACMDDERVEAEPEPRPIEVSWPSVEIGAIFEDPDAFVGKSLIVHGEVAEIISEHAFTIRDEGDEMLIVGGDLPIDDLQEGVFVRVNGAIRDFDVREIEDELGVEVEDDLLSAFRNEPSVIAATVTVGVTSVDDLMENIGVFVGRTVNVTGKVEAILSPQVFTLSTDESDTLLLVIEPEPARPENLFPGVWVRVLGQARVLDPVDLQEFGDDLDALPAADPEALLNDPVIVAETVEIVAPRSTVEIGDILNEPERFIGEIVTVSGPVEGVLAESVLTVESESALLGLIRDDILVIGGPGLVPDDLSSDAVVVVTGTVGILGADDADDALEELGLAPELQEEIRAAYVDQPVIRASAITVVETG